MNNLFGQDSIQAEWREYRANAQVVAGWPEQPRLMVWRDDFIGKAYLVERVEKRDGDLLALMGPDIERQFCNGFTFRGPLEIMVYFHDFPEVAL